MYPLLAIYLVLDVVIVLSLAAVYVVSSLLWTVVTVLLVQRCAAYC